ncbi:MarR family winged helix-turn-helix transcriptional regulator [Halalkalibacter lacteus]|uniref:MarR family winged helix-turn-helix transcriptional regulator n=1 Tax=Halalkalibacter lacteus TaxID=3090663 RepID=UPI002FC75667
MDEKLLDSFIKQYEDTYLFATKRIEHMISEELSPMTIEQFGILRQLALHGPSRPNELAKATGVHKSSITHKSDRLIAKGYITRSSDPGDRRYVYLSLTAEGEIVYQQSESAMRIFIKSVLEILEPREIKVLVNVQQKINHHIQNLKVEGC